MAYFDPTIALVFYEGIFCRADHVAPAEFVHTVQERVASVNAVSQQGERAALWNNQIQAMKQFTGVLGPGTVDGIDDEALRQADAIRCQADQDQVEQFTLIGLVQGDVQCSAGRFVSNCISNG
jgi:hypothetical protein